MTATPARLARALALGALATAGGWFLFSAALHAWPWFARTLFAWAVLVTAIAAVVSLAFALGLLRGQTLNHALANDPHHIIFGTFAGLIVAFWMLSIGLYAYADPRPPDNVDPWRVFVLYAASLFLAGSTRHPRWLYDRLRHSEGNELLKDTQSTRLIFLTLGGLLALYALATHPRG